MSSSVESRILTMKIDNRSFLDGVANTINALAKLKTAMNFSASNKGLQDLQATGSRFNLGGVGNAVDGVSAKFLAMSTVAITALANITNRAVDAGLSLAKSLTIDPIKTGLEEYETQLNSVQTILANTQASGATLNDVNSALDELNHYADKTVYNFAEMAKNIGTFTAAGVDLDRATASIKGIANLAALSGSNSQQASTAMYQLSQAISAGRVSLQDWNSVVNAGMGGTVFQRALAQTAEKMGTLEKGAVKLSGKMKNVTIDGNSFRESITAKPGEQSWLTSDVLTKTLEQFTGDLSNAELKAQGFNKAQIKAIQAQAKTAVEAATEVKTLSGLMDTTRESITSGWASTFELIFGDFEEAKDLWTGVSKVIGKIVGDSADARNKMLAQWKTDGGRDALLEGIAAGWKAIVAVVKPLREAFRDIFPKKTAADLVSMTEAFRDFMKNLMIGDETAEDLRRTFRGVFAIFSIVGQVVRGIVGVFLSLFGVVGEGAGGFLNFTGNIGDLIVAFDKALKKGNILEKFFDGISAVLAAPIRLIQAFAGFISDIFGGFDQGAANAVDGAVSKLGERFGWLSGLGDIVANVFDSIGNALGPLGQKIGEALTNIGDAIAKGFSTGDFSSVFDAINAGLLGGILLLIRKFVNDGLSFDFSGGSLSQIGEAFEALTGSMKAMQAQIQAKTLLMIASAVGVLTASVVALSLIDSKKLTKALTAMSVGFGQLLGAMAILVKISGAAGFVKVPIIAASMTLLAASLLILTAAIAAMGQLEWETIVKGLVGTAGSLVVIGLAMSTMPANLPLTAAGLALVGIALIEIAGAMAIMAKLSWSEIAKGLAGMAGAMVVLAAALSAMGPQVLLIGPGLIAVGVALGLIAGVMQIFAAMSWEEIGKAMVGLAGSLVILAGALYLMTGSIVGAAALLIITPALLALGGTMKILGSLSWGDIARGLVALGGALLVIALGLTAMIVAIPGAIALTIASKGLAVLAVVLAGIGALSWGAILKGLVGLAAALTIIGIAGALMTPIILPLIGLGAAMTLIGAGFALAGAGVLAFATAFSIFVGTGTAGIAMIGKLIEQIPAFASGVANGIVQFIVTLANGATEIVAAMQKLVIAMIDGIIPLIPRMRKLFVTLLKNGLAAVRQLFPDVVKTGMQMIDNLLTGLDKNVEKFTDKAVSIVTKFIRRLGSKENIDKFIQAGKDFVVNLGKGVADQIGKTADEIYQKAKDIGSDLIAGAKKGVENAIGGLVDAVKGVGGNVLGALGDGLNLGGPSKAAAKMGRWTIEGLNNGMLDNSRLVERGASAVADRALRTLSLSMSKVKDAVDTNLDLNPKISPVLDLTQLSQEASKISGVLAANPISASVSFDQATALSNAVESAREAQNESGSAVKAETNINLTQNNYSPKAISTVETYRQTNNQLSLAKEAFKKT